VKEFGAFKKKKEHLICFDSDGCVMDTMRTKHTKCFGPCLVDEWGLHSLREEILARWNKINLYTIYRGINRFRGLAMILDEINERHRPIDGIDALKLWVKTAPELSNRALKDMIDENHFERIFKKALSWSERVNRMVADLPPKDKLPFPDAKTALKLAHEKADVAIVSSANQEAVIEEWSLHGLISTVDVIMTQSDGSKASCIDRLADLGYEKDKILMCGDSPADLSAAERGGVLFYPILANRENTSWNEFISDGLDRFIGGEYVGEYSEGKKSDFYSNLGK